MVTLEITVGTLVSNPDSARITRGQGHNHHITAHMFPCYLQANGISSFVRDAAALTQSAYTQHVCALRAIGVARRLKSCLIVSPHRTWP